jgi:protein-S-isoprenylcysteine O-methyltransferase Ste14
MSAPTIPRALVAAPTAGCDPALPPLAAQWALRLIAAAVHVIFVAAAMRDYWGGSWWNGDFATLGPWLAALAAASGDSLGYFTDGLRSVAPWAVTEALAVALVFGVRFQFLMRLCAAAGLTVFMVQALAYYEPGRLTLLLMVVTEVVSVLLVLAARPAGRQDWRPLSALSTVCATFYFFALSFAPAERPLIGEGAGVALETLGVLWAIFAKLSLGRSFGLLPADRGIVTRGAYRVVRHPVYLGYFIYHLGYLLANFGSRNLTVFALLYGLQAMRVVREERLLRANPEYQAYCQKVRWRFVPGVF